MIIVTGTKRSGTSMWMQILGAAGFPLFGEQFPRKWEETIKGANPDGFYESILRQGIYWRTNPHPQSGAFFHPSQVTRHVAKVFIPGLARTDLAYIGRVVATMRHWRDYSGSIQRLHAMEDERLADEGMPPPRPTPWLEWWFENFTLIRDLVTRRYAVHVQSYDGLLRDPDTVIRKVLAWIGDSEADVAAAVAAVHPQNRTQDRPEVEVPGLDAGLIASFDLLYDVVDSGAALDRSIIERLNRTNEQVAPLIEEDRKRIAEERKRRGQGEAAPTPDS